MTSRISERAPHAIAVAVAKEAERLLTEYVLQPEFRRAVAAGRLESLSESQRIAARYLLYAAGGTVHSLVDLRNPLHAFVAEVTAGLLAQIGTEVGRPSHERVTAESAALVQGVAARFVETIPLSDMPHSTQTGSDEEATKPILDLANEYVTLLRQSVQSRRRR